MLLVWRRGCRNIYFFFLLCLKGPSIYLHQSPLIHQIKLKYYVNPLGGFVCLRKLEPSFQSLSSGILPMRVLISISTSLMWIMKSAKPKIELWGTHWWQAPALRLIRRSPTTIYSLLLNLLVYCRATKSWHNFHNPSDMGKRLATSGNPSRAYILYWL